MSTQSTNLDLVLVDIDKAVILPRYLTVAQTAAYLGFRRQTLYNQHSPSYRGRKIPGRVLINGCVRYDKRILDAWLSKLGDDQKLADTG